MKKGDLIKTLAQGQGIIKWVVENEMGVLFDSGDLAIIDTKETTVEIIKESPPEYQTSVDHMTDEQLRASIEELRTKRLSRPEVKRKPPVSEPPKTEEEKKFEAILASKTPEEILDLKRKLGLID